jgi:hypothetical protein
LPTAVRAARLIQCVRQFRPRIVHTHSFGGWCARRFCS